MTITITRNTAEVTTIAATASEKKGELEKAFVRNACIIRIGCVETNLSSYVRVTM